MKIYVCSELFWKLPDYSAPVVMVISQKSQKIDVFEKFKSLEKTAITIFSSVTDSFVYFILLQPLHTLHHHSISDVRAHPHRGRSPCAW